ncbi:reverse transcriptase domain-containing protein, partial [Tanacetum coccineum]
MKSRITPNPRRQPPEQSQKRGMETGAPEARHRLPVSSKDSNKTDLLHLGLGRGRRVVCSTGWEEKNEVHLHVLTAVIRVPTKRKPRCNQGSIIIRARRPGKLVDIRRVKTERNPFTPRIRHFNFPRTRMPDHVKTYDGSRDPEDHLKLFQAVAKTERWAMPTWCHMFNSTLTGNAKVWFDKLPRESIDSYEDLRIAFRENYLQQTKHIKDPVEIHHIKLTDEESTEDFMERYKAEILDVEGASECMKISGFMYSITHPELIKRLYEKILRSMDGMYRVTTSFLQGEVAAFSHTEEADRRDDQVRKIVVIHQRIKVERQAKGTKEGGDGRKRQAPSHLDDSTMGDGEEDGTEGPMIIEAEIGGHFVHRIYVDRGASLEVLYEHCFVRLQPEIRSQMIPATTSHIGFSRETIWLIGQISLLVKIGKTGIRKIRAVPSMAQGMLKFLVKGGTVTIRSSRVIPMECAMIFEPSTQHPVTSQVLEEKIKVAICPEYLEQTIAIGSTLTEKGRKELCALLRQNLNVLAWKPANMIGVLWHMAKHRLNVREARPPIRQKKRGQAPERNKAIREEMEKLVDARIMKEVHYHRWLSNPVMVKKHDGSWRMCVDFKDLNKACHRDGYPLPEIDWKVESLCGYPFKCFLDAYKGYHQIKMAEEDKEKTTFITSQGIFCYTKMSFGLKNVRATYQRLVDRAFQKQIGRNLEEGMFLGYKVNVEGLKVCPDKEDTVLSLPSPECLKDVQKLNGKLASLNRFLSKSGEKSLPFFKTLKKCTKKS